MKKVTLKDVAMAVGVSEMTASRALRGHRDVSDKTKELVNQRARQMGYIPNQVASMLASKSSRIIPMIVPSLRNMVFLDMISSAQEVINASGYQMMLMNTDYSIEREAEVVAQLLAWSPAALILPAGDHSPVTLELLRSVDFPVVEVMDLIENPIDMCVGFSHTRAGEDMGRYLIRQGYRAFAFCCHQLEKDLRGHKRYQGFRAAIVGAGLPEPQLIDIGQRVADMQDCTKLEQLAEQCGEFDCLYFINDDLAAAMLLTFQRLGIRVPQQVALAGFNDLLTGRFTSPRLTTTHTPRLEIGKIAAQCALKRIEGEPLETSSIDLGYELIAGESA